MKWLLFILLIIGEVSCNTKVVYDPQEVVINVDSSLFLTDGVDYTIKRVKCTLSDGTSSWCYEIVTNSVPSDHQMGPWCPDHITDGADKGGIWLENGQVYDVDGAFIQNMATFYEDDTWLMYDATGKINKTLTQEDCANAARPDVGVEYENYCVECLPSYVADLTHTYHIPISPVKIVTALQYVKGGRPGGRGPSVRGIAFNGVVFDAPAPTHAILGAYTLAPFDDAGGHINMHAGYHYHAATGVSTEIAQKDGHAPMIGYAMDGHGIYAHLDTNSNTPNDLDASGGHYDDIRGYHYHVAAAGTNSFLGGLSGLYAK